MSTTRISKGVLAALAAGVVLAAALAPSAVADDGTYEFRIVCKSGKVVIDTLPVLPTAAMTKANEESARKAACPSEYDASGAPKVPLAPNPRFDKTDLFQQTLDDILANRFRLRLTCPKACVLRSEVEVIVADKRLLLYGVSSKHRLAAGRLTTIPIRFSAATRAKLKGAKLARVEGFLEVSDAKGGKRTVTWQRTCRLAA
jgi:hypothetical protein